MKKGSRLRKQLRPVAHVVRAVQRRLLALVAPLAPSRLAATAAWARRFRAERRRRRQESRLTIGIDVTALWEPLTGVGWYLYRLIESLAHRDDIQLRLYGPSIMASPDLARPQVPLPTGPAIDEVLYQVPIHGMTIDGGRFIRALRRIEPWLIARERNRILFAPNYFLPRRFALCRAPRVAMIHDLAFRRLPWAVQDETRAQLERHLQRTLAESRHFVTPSEAVRQELIDARLLTSDRVTAIHHGPGQIATTEPAALPAGLEPGYVLHVGTIEPRKNVGFLIDLWRRLRAARPDVPRLVLSGKLGWETPEVEGKIAAACDEGWLSHLGYVDVAQLSRLYRSARAVVLPTLYEGFGFPAIEALSVGTPLLCSDIPVLREVAGEAALYAAAGDQEAWQQRIDDLLDHPEKADLLATRGAARAADFDWRRTGEKTLAAWSGVGRKGS